MFWWLLLLPLSAWGHGGLPAGNDAFLEDGELLGGGMALGLLLIEDGEPLWVSKGAVGPSVNEFHRRTDGSVLALTFDGIEVTTNGGCHWEPLALQGRQVRRIRTVDSPTHLLATLADGGLPGIVSESFDEGETWTPSLSLPDFFPRQIEVAEGGWFVSGFGDDPIRQMIVATHDAGETWLEPPAVAGLDVVLVGQGGGAVYAAEVFDVGSRLLWSDDGFQTMTELASFDLGRVSHVAEVDGGRLILVDGLQTWWQVGTDPAELRETGPSDCLGPRDGDALWVCADVSRDVGPFLRTTDGVTFEAPIAFDDVCPRACPPGSPGGRANVLDWQDAVDLGLGHACGVEPQAEPTPEPTPEPPVDGCDCGGGAGLALLPLLFVRRYSGT